MYYIGIAAYHSRGAIYVCCCCVSDCICVRALIGVNLVLVIGLRVLSVETSACARV